jgi:hypothetical protein
VPACASACVCECLRVRVRVRASCHVHAIRPEFRPWPSTAPGEYGGGRTPSDHDRHWLESPTGDLRDPTGRRPSRPDWRPSRPDWRPSRPDWRPSRPAVSPSYAQGSWYGTNRVVASAPGRLAGPAAPLLSTTGQPSPRGLDPSRSGSSVVRTARVSRKNRTRGRPPTPATPAWLPTQGAGPPGRGPFTGIVAPRLVCERGSPFAGAVAAPRPRRMER